MSPTLGTPALPSMPAAGVLSTVTCTPSLQALVQEEWTQVSLSWARCRFWKKARAGGTVGVRGERRRPRFYHAHSLHDQAVASVGL